MDEFIENFTEFRDWIYAKRDETITMNDVIEKFEELKLDKFF